MDLSRWNIPHLSKLRERTRDIRDFLGDVLEGDRELLKDPNRTSTESPIEAFAVSSDWNELDHSLALLKPGTTPEKILNEFAPYFDGALCLRNETVGSKKKSRLTGVILFGQSFSPPDAKGSELDLGLSGLRSGFVVKGRISPILKELRLNDLEPLREADAFAFSPTDGVVYVLFCSRPHPWQVSALENAYFSARDACHRRAPVRLSARETARGFFK